MNRVHLSGQVKGKDLEMPKTRPFDKYACRYEEWFEINPHVYHSELIAIKELLPSSGDGIEIGIGSGRFAKPLGISVGIEPSRKMREMAHQRGLYAIDGVAEDLPFPDCRIDFILMVTTICFLDNIEIALSEIFRVLKPGGSLIIGIIDKDSPVGKTYLKMKHKNPFYQVADFYSVDEVISFLQKAGFRYFACRQTIFNDPSTIESFEPIKEDYGDGSFVAIKAMKR
jgi:SAM-dependent methyltransferase